MYLKWRFVILFCLVAIGEAAAGNSAINAGQAVSGVSDDIEKANQSQVIYHDGFWWGVFKTTSGSWFVYKYDGGSWTAHAYTGIDGVSSADAFVNEQTGKLYIMVSRGDEKFSRMSYSSGSWTLDSGFPITINLENVIGDDPACLTQAFDGDLFIFYVSDNALKGLRSSNGGSTWSTFQIVSGIANSSLTDAIAFTYSGSDHVGLFIGEGSGDKNFRFFRLADNLSPSTPSNWVEESLPIDPEADDHTNIVRDGNSNLYMIGKHGSSTPTFYLFKRSAAGSWSSYTLQANSGTRPALGITDTTLIVCATVSSKIQYVLLDKNNLKNVTAGDWNVVIENGSNSFNNNTLSYQYLDQPGLDILVAAENTSSSEIWTNFITDPDASLPVLLEVFSAKYHNGYVQLEWSTYSEINNWKWRLLRKTEQQSAYMPVVEIPGSGNSSDSRYYQYEDFDVDTTGIVYYRLDQVDFSGKVNTVAFVQAIPAVVPERISLKPNFPNPFNPATRISFSLRYPARLSLIVYDAQGQKIRTLATEHFDAGEHGFTWDGRNDGGNALPTGVYFLRLSGEGINRTIRMMILR